MPIDLCDTRPLWQRGRKFVEGSLDALRAAHRRAPLRVPPHREGGDDLREATSSNPRTVKGRSTARPYDGEVAVSLGQIPSRKSELESVTHPESDPTDCLLLGRGKGRVEVDRTGAQDAQREGHHGGSAKEHLARVVLTAGPRLDRHAMARPAHRRHLDAEPD